MKKVIRLTESDLMRIVKRVISEQKVSTEGANNPNWRNLVSKLKGLSYSPKILSWTGYQEDHPMQSLNWGTAKGPNGKYALAIAATDSEVPDEEMELFNQQDRTQQANMHKWWKSKGYKTNGNTVFISFANADKLRSDLEAFFKMYPPQ